MKYITPEIAPGSDIPVEVEMATGDAAELYEDYSIASLALSNWSGGSLAAGLGAVSSAFSGSEIQLRFPAATAAGDTPYEIKVLATLNGPSPTPYKDWVFIKLYVRTP